MWSHGAVFPFFYYHTELSKKQQNRSFEALTSCMSTLILIAGLCANSIIRKEGKHRLWWELELDLEARTSGYSLHLHSHAFTCLYVLSVFLKDTLSSTPRYSLSPSIIVYVAVGRVVRVDRSALSCRYTQPDPAETPLVTAVTIKLCYNWFTALFCLSVRRNRFRLPSLCQRVIKPVLLAAGTVEEWTLRINFQESAKKKKKN